MSTTTTTTVTISVSGVGHVFVQTSAAFVELAGAMSSDGKPVNRALKRVSTSQKHRADAERNAERYGLQEVAQGVFVLRDMHAA